MFGYGICIGDESRYATFARASLGACSSPGSPVAGCRRNRSIFESYNLILDGFSGYVGLEGLVLLHDDVEIRDAAFEHKIRAAFSDEQVAIVGVKAGQRCGTWPGGTARAGAAAPTTAPG